MTALLTPGIVDSSPRSGNHMITLPERFDAFSSCGIDDVVSSANENVWVDGSNVRFADARALQSLVNARLRLIDEGADLCITTPSNTLRVTLELTGDHALLEPIAGGAS